MKSFSRLSASSLDVKKESWRSCVYDLTDGSDTYGKLSYSGIFRRKVRAESAENSWSLRCAGMFSLVTLIIDKNEMEIGRMKRNWIGSCVTVTLNDGSEIKLCGRGIFKRPLIWTDALRGEILTITPLAFSRTTAVVSINDTTANPRLPLLALLGIHVLVESRRRAAAAAV